MQIKVRGRRREKLFGYGRPLPLDGNGKRRVMAYARAKMRRTEPGKHYGELTAKCLDVLGALLFGFHNCHDGRCFPAYRAIADKAGCCPATVAKAIHALERAGILTWVHRLKRVPEPIRDMFGDIVSRWRVMRTSNAYSFHDPNPCAQASESKFQPRTTNQDSFFCALAPVEPYAPLQTALLRWGKAVRGDIGGA
jgi:hypothetical protein